MRRDQSIVNIEKPWVRAARLRIRWPRICHATWPFALEPMVYVIYFMCVLLRVNLFSPAVVYFCFHIHQLRAVSCAVLMAFGTNSAKCPGGDRLWLVDATGTYPVRALCIGGGLTTYENALDNDATVVSMVPTADAVNQRLLEWMRTHVSTSENEHQQPYIVVSAEEALRSVLELLAGGENVYDEKSGDVTGTPLLQRGTRLELGILGRSRLVRKRVSEVWGLRHQTHRSD